MLRKTPDQPGGTGTLEAVPAEPGAMKAQPLSWWGACTSLVGVSPFEEKQREGWTASHESGKASGAPSCREPLPGKGRPSF